MIHAITVKKAELLAALRKQPQHNVNVTGRERTDAGFKVAEGLAGRYGAEGMGERRKT